MDNAVKVYLNGRLMDASDARIDPTDRGLTLGDGLFETIAVSGGRPARLDAHLARLRDGAQVIGLDLPLGDGEIAEALAQVARANGIAEGVLRLTLTRGPAPRGLLPPAEARPSLMITGTSRALEAPAPVSAIIATRTRRNEYSRLSGAVAESQLLEKVLELGASTDSG